MVSPVMTGGFNHLTDAPPSLQTSPLNVRRIGGVAMAGKPALASVPVTQGLYRNRDCEDIRMLTLSATLSTRMCRRVYGEVCSRQLHSASERSL